jgi:hypothetical protein
VQGAAPLWLSPPASSCCCCSNTPGSLLQMRLMLLMLRLKVRLRPLLVIPFGFKSSARVASSPAIGLRPPASEIRKAAPMFTQ